MSLLEEYGDRRERKGYEEGFKEGFKEGYNKELKKIILSYINSGTPLSEISQKTGKSIEELNEILKD